MMSAARRANIANVTTMRLANVVIIFGLRFRLRWIEHKPSTHAL
jgi:hypothetical protein